MFFEPNETPEGYFLIGFKDIPFATNEGFKYESSYHVLPARLLGFSYDDYLKYCAVNGAKIRGLTGYRYPAWKDKSLCKKMCDKVNSEWKKFEDAIA